MFLTAAHCDEGVSRVAITFDSSYVYPSGTTYWGTWHADPDYSQAQSDPQDLAVVVLDKAVNGITPARLPAAGSLSALPGDQQFTSVGYGAQAVTNGPGGEYVGHACNYTTWGGLFFTGGSGDNLLGSCAGASHGPGPRAALANWSTFISQFTP